MKKGLKHKALALSALALLGGVAPTATGCSTSDNSFFTIKNDKGLEIEFCDVGASIYSMKLDDTYLTYHPVNKNVFKDLSATPYYYGKTLGRVAGRFEDGKFTLDGKTYPVQKNETGGKKNNCLHGGKDSFSFKTFTRNVEEKDDRTVVTFNYISKDGEAGFPASVDATVVYSLYKNENKLETVLEATPSSKTVINMSTHSLFRLGNSGDVLNYELEIPTSDRAEYENETTEDNHQIVVREKDISKGDIFDFRKKEDNTYKKIGEDIFNASQYDPVSKGYDHIWSFAHINDLEKRYVRLYNPENKIQLKVKATSNNVNGFIIYTNDYPRAGQIMQGDNKEDTRWAGITIEPYTYFSKFKTEGREGFGEVGIEPIIYDSDNKFHNSFVYEITKDGK